MSHTEIIIILSTASFASTFGVYALIRYIKIHTRPPITTLQRSGDIELGDYIEQTQPIYNYPDLTESAQIINYPNLPEPLPIITIQQQYERITNFVHNERVPSFWSSNPPSYQTIDRLNINCCLENNINLFDLLLAFFLGFLFFFLVNYLRSLYFENHQKIAFTKGISTDAITFTRDYQELLSSRLGDDPDYDIIYKDTYNHILTSSWTLFDIKDWLDLIDEQDYAVSFHLVLKTSEGLFLNYPKFILSDEFIVNKLSNPVIVSTFLSTQQENTYNLFNSDYNENQYIVIQYTNLMASH